MLWNASTFSICGRRSNRALDAGALLPIQGAARLAEDWRRRKGARSFDGWGGPELACLSLREKQAYAELLKGNIDNLKKKARTRRGKANAD